MNRSEFVIATALILFVAFMLGWFANWLVHRLTRVSQKDLGELDRLAQMVHEAEEARDAVLAEQEERERELLAQIDAAEAETRSALQALRTARGENAELRDYLARRNARG